MLRAVRRRLRLESCEDRSLPSGLMPIAEATIPNTSTAHTAMTTVPEKGTKAPTVDDDDAEYANDSNSGTTSEETEYKARSPNTEYGNPKASGSHSDGQLKYLTASPTYYPPSYYPSSPPIPTGPTTPTMADFRASEVPAVPASPVVNAQQVSEIPPPQQPPVIRMGTAAVPAAPQQDDIGPLAGPTGATEMPPPVDDIDLPPVGARSMSVPVLDNLDIHVNLNDWAKAANRLLDGLDAMTSSLDGDSPWVRLGYWVLAVGTVGVSIELTRQGLRARLPEPEVDLALRVTR